MNAKIKTGWLAALRSGEYKQAKGLLRRGIKHESFCCLGLLAVINGTKWTRRANRWVASTNQRNAGQGQHSGMYYSNNTGLTVRDASILAEMNDNGIKFPEIADYIENNL